MLMRAKKGSSPFGLKVAKAYALSAGKSTVFVRFPAESRSHLMG